MQVTGADISAARTITGATFAAFILVGFIPSLRAHATRIRIVITVGYFVVAAGFMAYLLIR
jgi:hypothetical protein